MNWENEDKDIEDCKEAVFEVLYQAWHKRGEWPNSADFYGMVLCELHEEYYTRPIILLEDGRRAPKKLLREVLRELNEAPDVEDEV
jgi:hypothetical protein